MKGHRLSFRGGGHDLRGVNCMVCAFYLNKAVERNQAFQNQQKPNQLRGMGKQFPSVEI